MTSERPHGLTAIRITSREQAVKDGYLVQLVNGIDKSGKAFSVVFTLGAVFDMIKWDEDEQEARGLSADRREAVHRERQANCAAVLIGVMDEWKSEGEPAEYCVLTVVQRSPLEDGDPEPDMALLRIDVDARETSGATITVSRVVEHIEGTGDRQEGEEGRA